MNERLKEKMTFAVKLLNPDGTVTPSPDCPDWLLNAESDIGFEVEYADELDVMPTDEST